MPPLFLSKEPTNVAYLIFFRNTDGEVKFRYTVSTVLDTIGTPLAGEQAVIITSKKAPGQVGELYLDGTLEAQATQTGAIDISTGDLYIGGSSINATNNAFNGKIAEILLYNRNLTSAEQGQIEQYLSYKWGISL